MKINAKYANLVFAVVMSSMMSLVMTCFITAVNTGIDADFLARWLVAWVVAWPVAFVCNLLLAARVRRWIVLYTSMASGPSIEPKT